MIYLGRKTVLVSGFVTPTESILFTWDPITGLIHYQDNNPGDSNSDEKM